MAFDISKLMRASLNHGGFKLWTYESDADSKADVNTSGYMNEAANSLDVGDRIFCKLADGNVDMFVASNDGTVVDLTDGVDVAATDSD